MVWHLNPGHCPPAAIGKRVRVQLANKQFGGLEAVSTTSPIGWPADGPSGCRWTLTGHPADIDKYEVIA